MHPDTDIRPPRSHHLTKHGANTYRSEAPAEAAAPLPGHSTAHSGPAAGQRCRGRVTRSSAFSAAETDPPPPQRSSRMATAFEKDQVRSLRHAAPCRCALPLTATCCSGFGTTTASRRGSRRRCLSVSRWPFARSCPEQTAADRRCLLCCTGGSGDITVKTEDGQEFVEAANSGNLLPLHQSSLTVSAAAGARAAAAPAMHADVFLPPL